MHLDSRGGVSVAELVIFAPALLASLPVCIRHGFNRSSGWVFTLILCFIRIVGAACQLGTYSNHSGSLIRATLVFDSIGLTPLLLATLGLLSRVINWIQIREQELVGLRELRLIRVLIMVGLILSIVGGSTAKINVYDPYHTITDSSSSKAAIILYIVAYAGLLYMTVLCAKHISSVPFGEKRIGHAVLIAMPLIFIRLVYSALNTFKHNKTFNIYNGSVAALVCMAVLEEFIVVIVFIMLGYVIPLMNPDQQPPSATRDIFEEDKTEGTREQTARHQRGQTEEQVPQQEVGYTQDSVLSEPVPAYSPPGSRHPEEGIQQV